MNLTNFKGRAVTVKVTAFCNQQLIDITCGNGTNMAVTVKRENIPPKKTILSRTTYVHKRPPSPTYILFSTVTTVTSTYYLIILMVYRLQPGCNFAVTGVTSNIIEHLAACPSEIEEPTNLRYGEIES